jgi:hypothetical protein
MPSIRNTSKSVTTPTGLLLALIATLAIALAAPAAGNAAPVKPPQLAIDPGSYDFGLQPVYSNAQAGFQLRNEGTEAIQLESVQIVGPGSSAFWVGNCVGWWLQPGESCFAQVNFNPQYQAEFDAELRVSVEGHQFGAPLSGEGGQAILAPGSNPTDFGAVAVDSPGVIREIEISNVGNLPGGAFIAVISGGAVGSFQLLDENCTGVPLAPAATCTVQVRFRPLSEGAKKATLGLFGDSSTPTQVILTGVGSAPEPEPVSDSFDPQAHAQAASGSSVTSIVKRTTHRVTRPRIKVQKRKPHRRQGLRHHRRASIASANRIP